MILTAYDRLKADANLQEWWQSVLDDPRTALVFEAARAALEREIPEIIPGGTSTTEFCVFQYSAREGSKAAFVALESLGSTEMVRLRAAEAQAAARAGTDKPAKLGTGPGQRAKDRRHTSAGPS